ncbi:MAG: helix-turn-helix transcriptional regulator [Acutalibacteraceae bacterium]
MDNRLPALLRTLRKKYGYTQEYVASQIHIDRTTYGGYESGAYEPSYSTIAALSKLYGVQLQVFDLQGKKAPYIDYVSDSIKDIDVQSIINEARETGADINELILSRMKKIAAVQNVAASDKYNYKSGKDNKEEDIQTPDDESSDATEMYFSAYFNSEDEDRAEQVDSELINTSYSAIRNTPITKDEQIFISAYRLLSAEKKNEILTQIKKYLSEDRAR